MAVFEGSVQEFHRFVGPRIRNAINLFVKKERDAKNRICEHCNRSDRISDSAHVHGRDRRSIIENILSLYERDGIVRCNIEAVEREILAGHGVVADTFKFLNTRKLRQSRALVEPPFGIRQIVGVPLRAFCEVFFRGHTRHLQAPCHTRDHQFAKLHSLRNRHHPIS
jgi:hypothetical protein